ncbi:MAG TPA: restriction endonuclease subunit S [Saprospiraceae bacterium]|nr:restriction endonuclease subunit S [Saprospiraceae bacterium]HMP25512.1 restriction endonuclease subunit S [Saprospiraceae bacterium]
MKTTLGQVATISTGVYAKTNAPGNVQYLQAKYFDERGTILPILSERQGIPFTARLSSHLLQDGDVLFMAKGDRHQACLYRQEMGRAIASTSFLVVRIQDDKIMPAYLQWFLNTAILQKRLASLARGTHIPSISKKTLQELEIHIPSLSTQEAIIDIHALWQREQELSKALLREKATWYEHLLMQMTH